LALGDKNNRMMKDGVSELPKEQILTPEQITDRYPALENIPKDYVGFISNKAGIIKSKVALDAYKSLCEEAGVELKYNSKVTEVSKNWVITEDGTKYEANHVVVATGPYTGKIFDVDDPNLITIQQEYYEISDSKGMPDLFIELGSLGGFNGMLNGDGFNGYKLSLHEEKDFEKVKTYVKTRLPSKADELLTNKKSHMCWWCFNTEKFWVYETKDNGVHYLYGFKGHGFTYMPLHGKIVYESLIKKNVTKYLKF
jgi:glycine/D-amino acid oxidase-like deaminating enzyme